ncbi:hypothetical protein BaRGS_00023148, partial [Batillaria attramentaria]
ILASPDLGPPSKWYVTSHALWTSELKAWENFTQNLPGKVRAYGIRKHVQRNTRCYVVAEISWLDRSLAPRKSRDPACQPATRAGPQDPDVWPRRRDRYHLRIS